ncbi:MAG: phiB5 01 [Marmoricola sp.]|nr:phiB5 01 [Marmoricola sp.]
MLQIQGKALDVSVEHVTPANMAAFDSTTVSVLTGKAEIEKVRIAGSFDGALPKEGEEVTLNVVISAFATRGGAGYRLTALSRVQVGARPAVASVHA